MLCASDGEFLLHRIPEPVVEARGPGPLSCLLRREELFHDPEIDGKLETDAEIDIAAVGQPRAGLIIDDSETLFADIDAVYSSAQPHEACCDEIGRASCRERV